MKDLYYKIKSVSDLELTLDYVHKHSLICTREYLSWFDNNDKELKSTIIYNLTRRLKQEGFMILVIKDPGISFLSSINDIHASSNEIQYIRHIEKNNMFSKVDELLNIIERINNENL